MNTNDDFNEILGLDFYQLQKIKEIEKRTLHKISNEPKNLLARIVYLLSQIMLGDKAKAYNAANKIWEIGGKISPLEEAIYIDCLINLGLRDMAEILLKSKYEQLTEKYQQFGNEMLKFAIQQGNLSRLARINSLKKEQIPSELSELLATYRRLDSESDFSNVLKIIFEVSHKHAIAYEYIFYSDRGFAELEVVIYTNHDPENGQKFEKFVNQKIDAFYASINKKRINNIFVSVLMTSEHYAIKGKSNKIAEQNIKASEYDPSEWGF